MKKKAQAPENPKLTQEELWTMRALDAERQLARKTLECHMLKREAVLRQLDPNGLLAQAQEIIAKSSKAADEFDAKLSEYQKRIEARLGLSLKQHSYDDETGDLLFVD